MKDPLDVAAFSVPFLLFSVDLWLHAPVKAPLKHVALFLSLAVVPSGRFEAFVLAEALWVASLILSMLSPAVVPEEAEPQEKVAAPGEVSKEKEGESLAEEGMKKVQEGLKKVVANLNEATSCDGKPWKVQENKDGIKISCSDVPGESVKRWKVETTIQGATLEELMSELFDYDRRVGANGWDTAIKEGQVLKEFDNTPGAYSLSRMVTNAAAGGNVSSREFLDVRGKFMHGEHPDVPQGGVLIAMCGIDPKKDRTWLKENTPQPDKKLVLGLTLPGAGVCIKPVEDGGKKFKYTLVSNLKLGGWLPASLINSVTAGALLESHQAMLAHLKKKFA